jgi:alkylation response protein AidB-like acyl-CoA dehydrogenase
MVAGQGVPRGQARRVDGGFITRGEWSYGSGIYHAELVHSGCTVMAGDKPEKNADGVPEVILAHFDPKEMDLRDNWNVLGLRGTGSYDYTLKSPELFVPDYMCYRYAADVPVRGGNQYSVGLIGFTSWGHTAWALGIGRRVLDEIAKLARSKGNVFGALGEGAAFKHSYAAAEAKYRSARAFCYEAWTDLSESLLRDQPATVEQIALVRIAMRHIHDVVSEISTFAHRAGGGVSLRPSVLQRCFRDLHSGTQHILLSDQIFQECGRALLGMTGKNSRWSIFGVLD